MSASIALWSNPLRVEQRFTARLPTPPDVLRPVIKGLARSAVRSGDEAMRRADENYTVLVDEDQGLQEHVDAALLAELAVGRDRLILNKAALEEQLKHSRDLLQTIRLAFKARKYAKTASKHHETVRITSEEARAEKAVAELQRELNYLQQLEDQLPSETIADTGIVTSCRRLEQYTTPQAGPSVAPKNSTNDHVLPKESSTSGEASTAMHSEDDSFDADSSYHTAEAVSLKSALTSGCESHAPDVSKDSSGSEPMSKSNPDEGNDSDRKGKGRAIP